MKKRDQQLLEEAYQKIIGEVSAAWAQKRLDSGKDNLPDTGFNRARISSVEDKIGKRIRQDTNSIPVIVSASSLATDQDRIPSFIQLMKVGEDGKTLQVVVSREYSHDQGPAPSTTDTLTIKGSDIHRGTLFELTLDREDAQVQFPDRGAANQFIQAYKTIAATARTATPLDLRVQQLPIVDADWSDGRNNSVPTDTLRAKQQNMQQMRQGQTKNFNPAVKTPLPHPNNREGFTSTETTAWNQAKDASMNR